MTARINYVEKSPAELSDLTFEHLLATWNAHQDLRDAGVPIAELSLSRCLLDAARLASRRSHR